MMADVLVLKAAFGGGRLLRLLAVSFVICSALSVPGRAEPIFCLRGQKGCGEWSLERKVQTSFERAEHAFVGTLESIENSKHGIATTRIFKFRIEQQFKGALAGDSARLSIDSHLTGAKGSGAGAPISLSQFEQLEVAAESRDTEKAKNQYASRVRSLRELMEKNGATESVPTHVVRLDLTYGDLAVRTTDIPMRIGERYAVFVFSKFAFAPGPEIDGGNFSTWTDNPVDLYSLNDDRGKRALASLEHASNLSSR